MNGRDRRAARRLLIGGVASFVAFFPYALACLLIDGQFSTGVLPVIGLVILFGGMVVAGFGLIWLELIVLTRQSDAERQRLAEMKAKYGRRSG